MPASIVNSGSREIRDAIANHADLIDDGIEGAADDVTLENVDGVVSVKDGGVDTDQLADEAVTLAKLATAVQGIIDDYETRIAALEAEVFPE
jgi:hypothetical protein